MCTIVHRINPIARIHPDFRAAETEYYVLRSYVGRSRKVSWHRVVALRGFAGLAIRRC